MRVIQLSVKAWLVLDERTRPRFLISRAPMIHKRTGETHVVHRVERWNHIPTSRKIVAVCDGERDARNWCAAAFENEARAASRQALSTDPATGLTREQLARVHSPSAGGVTHAHSPQAEPA